MKSNYLKFGLMMIVSFIIMYAVMFLNLAKWDHLMVSATRTYMTLLMIAPMAISMMLFMWKMYKDKKTNVIIISVSVVVFILSLIGLRKQVPISDVQYMKAMIPHHSSAILVSNNANLYDPEVIELSKEIIEAQEKEIALMKAAIQRLESE
ncbi:MAG: DUF305 domain-containing protein [Flavobacteriaceae bacterium]|nr:DUF305 domain-containing protein [Flavobacteriaceae bacterium]